MNESRITKPISLRSSVWRTLETGALATDSTPGLFVEIVVSLFLKNMTPEEIFEIQGSVATVEKINELFGENEG